MIKRKLDKEDIFHRMNTLEVPIPLTLPPPAFKDLGGEFVEYISGESLMVSFTLQKKQENPGGVILGGYFSAYFDMAFGPFSFLETNAWTVSLDLNVCFLKPLRVSDKKVLIHARLISKTKSNIIIHGEAYKENGKELVATCNSRMLIMKPK